MRHAWLTHGHLLTSVIAPPVCLLCGGEGQPGPAFCPPEPWGLDLCIHCEAALPEAGPPRLPPGMDEAHALFLYAPPVDQLIQRLKFQHQLAPARVLGMLMARARRGTALPLALVPVPLHPRRLRERGFNQSAEIGRHVARRLALPLRANLLERQRHTPAQSGLDAADRARNIAGAFRVRPGEAAPARVALLDDVLTTGATAAAAARALRAAGCREVLLWVCARTPREHPGGFC